jgi:hypothetical protein
LPSIFHANFVTAEFQDQVFKRFVFTFAFDQEDKRLMKEDNVGLGIDSGFSLYFISVKKAHGFDLLCPCLQDERFICNTNF